MSKLTYPAWFNGPDGEAKIFNDPAEVPKGWTSGADKAVAEVPKKSAAKAEPEAEPESAIDL